MSFAQGGHARSSRAMVSDGPGRPMAGFGPAWWVLERSFSAVFFSSLEIFPSFILKVLLAHPVLTVAGLGVTVTLLCGPRGPMGEG